jgi:hypothetical protein
MSARIRRVVAASLCCGLVQASAWPTVNPTHDMGFLQPGRVSKISQPNLRHLKIVIEIDEVEHHPIANGGANYTQYWISWEVDSSVATNVPLQMPSWPLFLGPGGEPEFDGKRIVYHGEVPNGCNADVDLQLHLTVNTSPDGEQTYSDHISGHGYYHVYIPIHVYEYENEASYEFVFRGQLRAYCVSEL